MNIRVQESVRVMLVTERELVDRVLAHSFSNYPVMRYVIGNDPAYSHKLAQLVSLFSSGRWLRNHPVIGLHAAEQLVAAATLTPPGLHETPQALEALTEQSWRFLGEEAEERYGRLKMAWASTGYMEPAWHLNMLGVLPSHCGKGLGRALLGASVELAKRDGLPLELTTESEANLPFYQRCGFSIFSQAVVDGDLRTWTLVAE